MKDKTRYLLFGVWAVLVIGFFAFPIMFSSRARGPMLAMPVVVARDGVLIQAQDIRSFQYQFAEVQGPEGKASPVEGMRDAKTWGDGFLVDAPFTESWPWMFGRTTISPQYRSLRLRLVFLDGTTLSLSLPVISDTALNRPIRIDLEGAEAGKTTR